MGNSPLKKEIKCIRTLAQRVQDQLAVLTKNGANHQTTRKNLQDNCQEIVQKVDLVLTNFVDQMNDSHREVLKRLSAHASLLSDLVKIVTDMDTKAVDSNYSFHEKIIQKLKTDVNELLPSLIECGEKINETFFELVNSNAFQ